MHNVRRASPPTCAQVRTREQGRRSTVDGGRSSATVSHARTVRRIAVPCSAVQCSADCSIRTVNTVHTSYGLESGLLAEASAECHVVTPLLGTYRPQLPPSIWASPVFPPHPGPFCPLPSSSLHTHWLSATCFTCQGTSLRIRAARYWAPHPPPNPPTLPHHPVLRFRSRGLLG
jgi:hypothetical protein